MLSKEQLESKVKELCKGQYALMQSRKKWKIRYYKERKRRKEANKAVWQIYEDYQDAGKKMFEYAEQVEHLETNNKKLIEKLEEVKQENKQLKEQDNNIILQQIFNALYNNETKSKLEEILEIAKGEK